MKTFRTVVGSLQILNPGHSGSSSTFSFASQNGQSYTILFKKALTDPVWLTNGVVTGNGGTYNYTDTSATNGARFYQVRTP